MSCCAPGAELGLELDHAGKAPLSAGELLLSSHELGNGLRQSDLSVPSVHCGACIQTIEKALGALDGVAKARVNLSTKRVSVQWRGTTPPPLIETLNKLGYQAHPFETADDDKDETLAELVRALGVAGFAAANIMLLSVSVWSGAEDATRDLFHWISALIAIPAMAYSGRIFFRSAFNALRRGRTNMDVPITIGVSLAYGMSIYETLNHGPHAYFDAAVSLLFFLLIGRTLDHFMRERARVAVKGLARLAAKGAMVIRDDGTRDFLPVSEIVPGMRVLIAAGERVPVDARIEEGTSDLDCSLVTGESEPQRVGPGSVMRAGTLNLTGPITATATAAAKDSFLAEMIRLMEAAEGGRARYRRIADRASQLYAPAVHLTAFITMLGWLFISGDWHRAITIAIAVLIITCPCALGLAVPIVQVVAARRLFENGIMVRDGSAMERLAEADWVVFDKTGTLTLGAPQLVNREAVEPAAFGIAAAMAAHSRHPLSKALTDAARGLSLPALKLRDVAEHPGYGLEAKLENAVYRLGRADWALSSSEGMDRDAGTVLACDGRLLARFTFEDQVRPGAVEAVSALRETGLENEIVSGDRAPAVAQIAGRLGISKYHAGILPGGKAEHLAERAAEGRKVLMVGDGLNDAPALVAAHVSMAPATAADVGRNAADFVFLRENLNAVPLAFAVSREAGKLIRQNFALAIGYNVIAVPIAILGHVTPLVAALAMSLSSVMVVANALRLRAGERPREQTSRSPALPVGRSHPGLQMKVAS